MFWKILRGGHLITSFILKYKEGEKIVKACLQLVSGYHM